MQHVCFRFVALGTVLLGAVVLGVQTETNVVVTIKPSYITIFTQSSSEISPSKIIYLFCTILKIYC